MKLLFKLAVGMAGCTLAACGGGGGGGGISSTPTPPPPQSQPAGPVYSSFTPLQGQKTIEMSGGTHRQVTTASGPGPTSTTYGTFENSNLWIAYDEATNTYTVSHGGGQRSFGPSTVVSDVLGPSFQSYGIVNSDAGWSESLNIYRPNGGGPTSVGENPTLTYTTLVAWTRYERLAAGPNSDTELTIMWGVGGFETVASDMPRTGEARYNGIVVGHYASGTRTDWVLSGWAKLTANFGGGTVLADLGLSIPGQSTLLLDGSGLITGSRFAGTLTGGFALAEPTFKGPFEGAFFGPQAAEFGLSFSVGDGAGSNVIGVAAGKP